MNKKALREWLKLPDETKKNVFTEISKKTALPAIAIEKDWWVVILSRIREGFSRIRFSKC